MRFLRRRNIWGKYFRVDTKAVIYYVILRVRYKHWQLLRRSL